MRPIKTERHRWTLSGSLNRFVDPFGRLFSGPDHEALLRPVFGYYANVLQEASNESPLKVAKACTPRSPCNLFLELVRREDQTAVGQIDAPPDRAKLLLETVGSGLPPDLLPILEIRFKDSQAEKSTHWAEGIVWRLRHRA